MKSASAMVERPLLPRTAAGLPRYVGIAPMALFAVGFLYLALQASGQAYTAFDLRVAHWVQGVDVPGLGWLVSSANFLTDGPVSVTIWLAAGAFLVLRGRPLEAIAVFMIMFFWVANGVIATIVDRPASDVAGLDVAGTFLSGHVTGSVTLYGLLAVLTLANFPPWASAHRGPGRRGALRRTRLLRTRVHVRALADRCNRELSLRWCCRVRHRILLPECAQRHVPPAPATPAAIGEGRVDAHAR